MIQDSLKHNLGVKHQFNDIFYQQNYCNTGCMLHLDFIFNQHFFLLLLPVYAITEWIDLWNLIGKVDLQILLFWFWKCYLIQYSAIKTGYC